MPYPKLAPFALCTLPLLLSACSTVPKAPSCDASAYRSLNPAHYDPVKESTSDNVPFFFSEA
ncbi:MAG: hypothetical protein VBE63_18710 [Lamprobacter sp.]|uniref:hypothetical protein n=1 Tax=Lamprobacter sp. TaxID=3100796 RepID=UPI002B25DF5C|nr:hypothetical protein [Lamprobacter sp.]MEA3641949.1 hypothetical protein [Lamprobacter sp.]